ncbi:hypothetical protein [Natronincola ferrireducens]|uniref:Sporulation related domain-containing protein n=1 Tax=Natronincola ferrireducens TaxID=393762 RepID=A0A1G9D5M6_9FIRM|nr:hypothetical protein [Natronincola ferrireducens]SDK59014.1 hypothetical protein SAMN05660472_01647 [Natronincola ferrireducens]
MRGKRFAVRRTKRNYNYGLIILFLVIIPLSAIFIGSRITERLVMPVLYSDMTLEEEELQGIINDEEEVIFIEEDEEIEESGNQVKNNGEEDMIYKDLSPLSIYMIQVASVSDTSNIEDFIAELNENKLSHLIYKMDNVYKVYTLGLTEREFVEGQLPKVKEFYPDAYISEVHSASKKLTYPKTQQQLGDGIVKELNSLIEIMDKQSKEWYNFIEKEGELRSYKELLLEQEKIVKRLAESIQDKELPEGIPEKKVIDKMLYHQESNIKRSQELLEDEENLYRVHSLFLDSIFRILETIK